jgi:hypothetical protein
VQMRGGVDNMSRPFKLQTTARRSRRPRQVTKITISSGRKKIDEPRYLSGWKEIASYLGKGVRTVQRYERHMGFPVRRPAGKPRAAVIATKAEVDAWVAASPIRREFRLSRSAAVAPKPSISSAIGEMHRLVRQTHDLRDELRTWVHVLAETIQQIEGETRKRFDSTLQMDIKTETDRLHGLLSPHLNPPLTQRHVS